MGFLKQRTAIPLFIVLFISFSAQFGVSIRLWQGEQLFGEIVPNFESLQKGPVPPSAGSPCTNIPGGSGICVVNEMNVAGHLLHSPPAFPGINVIKFVGTTSMEE
ncbi:hypothetical protein CRYUN_Cryun40dG0035000 [Craigia yunnanensis]